MYIYIYIYIYTYIYKICISSNSKELNSNKTLIFQILSKKHPNKEFFKFKVILDKTLIADFKKQNDFSISIQKQLERDSFGPNVEIFYVFYVILHIKNFEGTDFK